MDISDIKKLAQQNKVVPFIGSGFSMSLDFPSWGTIIRELAIELDWDSDVFMQSGNNNYLQLAEYYCIIKGGRSELRRLMEKKMYLADDIIKASVLHQKLVQLSPKIIYTTNYDEAIESSFRVHNKNHTVIRNINDFVNSQDGNTLIYKFHGDFIHENSLVLTESSYFDRLSFDHPLDIRLRSDVLNNTLLFLGYSLSDINMRYLFYKLGHIQSQLNKNSQHKTAIMVTFNISEIQKAILRQWKIETYELDPIDKTQSLIDFLEKLMS